MENGTELNAFQWDDTVPEIDFFGEVASNPNKGAPLATKEKEVVEDKPSETTKLNDDATVEEPEIDFFGESNKGEEGDILDEPGEGDDEDTDEVVQKPKTATTKVKPKEGAEEGGQTQVSTSNVGVANFLKEKGFIDFELEEGDELDEAGAEALIEDAFEDSVEQRLEDTIASLPDSVKNLVKFAAKGGDVDEYLANVNKTSSQGVSKTLDMTKEVNQEKFMRFKLANEGNDEEYIEFQIEAMKDSGKLESLSSKAFGAWKKTQDDKDAELVEEQKARVATAKQNAINFKRDISKHVSEVGQVNNIKFSRQDIRELPDYITSATEKMEDGRVTAPFYKELSEALKDKDKLLLMAKIVKSGFNFKDIEKTAATRVAQGVKKDIQRQQQENKTNISTAGGGSQAKRLADYFND